MNKNTIIVVFSCQKNKNKQEVYKKHLTGYNYIIVEGGYSKTSFKDSFLQLNVEDDYNSLPKKVFATYSYLLKKHKQVNILKIDDDTYLDTVRIKKINFNFDYGGMFYTDIYKNTKIKFAFGGGYYLSNKALKLFVNNFQFYNGLGEDKTVGYILMPFYKNLTLLNSGAHIDGDNIQFTCLFNSIVHPVDTKIISQLTKTKLKNFFYKKP